MVHQAPAPVAHGSAPTPDPDDARPLRLLRDHGQRTASDVVPPPGRAHLEKRALAPQPIRKAELEPDGAGP